MSPLAIAGIVGTVYVVVVTFTYALMKMASDADDDIRAMEKENELLPLPLHIKRAIERAEHDAFLNGGGA